MDKNKSYLAIISCKSGKMDYACEAKELYSKNVFFREQFAFLEAAYDKILIASAKYDLILPTKIIEPYELSFDERVRVNKIRNIAGNEYKKQWGIKVKNQIDNLYPSIQSRRPYNLGAIQLPMYIDLEYRDLLKVIS